MIYDGRSEKIRFEDRFPHDKEQYYTVIVFFDNMIRRDFLTILNRMENGISCMLCDTVGYELPENEDEDCVWKYSGCIKLWFMCGDNEHSILISYGKFIEYLRLSAEIWIKNNSITDMNILSRIDISIDSIERRYLK